MKGFLKVTQQIRWKQHRCSRLREKCAQRDGSTGQVERIASDAVLLKDTVNERFSLLEGKKVVAPNLEVL